MHETSANDTELPVVACTVR